MITTTFKELYENKACVPRYKHLAKQLGGIGKYGRTKPITLLQILDSNGLGDAFWALRVCKLSPEDEKKVHLLACDFAEHVLPIFERNRPRDSRPRVAIETKRKWMNGEATDEERNAACAAARDAAWGAARAAASAAARDAAWGAASAAARDAAWGAAWAAAWAAAWGAEKKWQEEKLREMLR